MLLETLCLLWQQGDKYVYKYKCAVYNCQDIVHMFYIPIQLIGKFLCMKRKLWSITASRSSWDFLLVIMKQDGAQYSNIEYVSVFQPWQLIFAKHLYLGSVFTCLKTFLAHSKNRFQCRSFPKRFHHISMTKITNGPMMLCTWIDFWQVRKPTDHIIIIHQPCMSTALQTNH